MPGQSGNPLGRPKGAKHKFGEAFWNDLHREWSRRGRRALESLDDEEFAKLAANKAPTLIEAEIDVKLSGWLAVVRGADGGGDS